MKTAPYYMNFNVYFSEVKPVRTLSKMDYINKRLPVFRFIKPHILYQDTIVQPGEIYDPYGPGRSFIDLVWLHNHQIIDSEDPVELEHNPVDMRLASRSFKHALHLGRIASGAIKLTIIMFLMITSAYGQVDHSSDFYVTTRGELGIWDLTIYTKHDLLDTELDDLLRRTAGVEEIYFDRYTANIEIGKLFTKEEVIRNIYRIYGAWEARQSKTSGWYLYTIPGGKISKDSIKLRFYANPGRDTWRLGPGSPYVPPRSLRRPDVEPDHIVVDSLNLKKL